MHGDSENFIKYQGGLEFQSLRAVSVRGARVDRRQIDSDVSGTREKEEKNRGVTLLTGLCDTVHKLHACVYAVPCSDAQGQNFKVFWKRSFSQLRVSPRTDVPPETRGRNAHEEKGLQVRSYDFGRSQTEVLLSPAFGEATCTDLSTASWLPLQAPRAWPPRPLTPARASRPVHPQHGTNEKRKHQLQSTA